MAKQIPQDLPTQARRGRWLASTLLLALMAACSDSPAGPVTGSLVVTIGGLPSEAPNAVSVSGPTGSGFSRQLSATDTLRDLVAGIYTIQGNLANTSAGAYAATTPSQQVEVVVSDDPAHVEVEFVITTGSIALNVTGLPAGAAAAVSIIGPGGYSRNLTESTLLTSLTPGSYSISNSSVQVSNGHTYAATPFSQTFTISASETPRNVTTTYALATGAVEVSISGLPAGTNGDVTVTGPGGFSKSMTSASTLAGLFPGTYTVAALNVAGSSAVYAPTPTTQPLTITPSLIPVRASVTYSELNAPPPPDFNLSIDGMYVTQAVQRYAGDVPLIAGMPALIRVFVKASAPNTLYPSVRVRVFNGASLTETITVQPNTPGVPTSIAEGNLFSSWNAILPASVIQPGLRIQADVDPTNTIGEASEGDNAFPLDGGAADVRVESTTPLNVTFVPVFQAATGLTGGVTTQNLDEFLAFTRKVMPVKDYRVLLHEPFSTSAPVLESNNGNNGWFHVLGEINALRVAEGSADYYVGIVGTTYTSGVAGMAFTPGRAALAWDKLPNASSITAHELGHSLGRLHAPCGGVASPDPAYPHPFGTIGVHGYDIATGRLMPPATADLMGYCGFDWISDYNYEAILNYRRTTPSAAVSAANRRVAGARQESSVQSNDVQPSLVLWGRIIDGRPVLEPAFSATTRPVVPSSNGPHRIEALAADGRVVFAYSFEGEEPSDVVGQSVRQFAFAIPVDAATSRTIARVRLTSANGVRSEQVASAHTPGSGAMEATPGRPGELAFRIRDPGVRFAVVRARATGRILAFVRGQGPTVRVRSSAVDFDVQYSDGVRSTSGTVRAIRR